MEANSSERLCGPKNFKIWAIKGIVCMIKGSVSNHGKFHPTLMLIKWIQFVDQVSWISSIGSIKLIKVSVATEVSCTFFFQFPCQVIKKKCEMKKKIRVSMILVGWAFCQDTASKFLQLDVWLHLTFFSVQVYFLGAAFFVGIELYWSLSFKSGSEVESKKAALTANRRLRTSKS